MIDIPRGREVLLKQIANVEAQLGTAALLGTASELSVYLHPRPLRRGRTLQGDWIEAPPAGIRAFSKEMLDAVIMFSLRVEDEPMGVHVEPPVADGENRITLMAADPAGLQQRKGYVAIVSPLNFEPVDHGDGIEDWSFIDATSAGVAILGGASVTCVDLASTVFQVGDPSRAFYEDSAPC